MTETRNEKTKVLHQIISVLNAGTARRENRDGREMFIVPFKTMKGDQALNGIEYPSEEIRNSVWSFENILAPVGHPHDSEGRFIHARSNEGLARGYVGAHCENCEWVEPSTADGKGRIHGNFVIDIAVAQQTDDGRWLLKQVNKGAEIPTSTGLLINVEMIGDRMIARDIFADHNAWLRDEKPAASIESGTGAFVNKDGSVDEVRHFVGHASAEGSEIVMENDTLTEGQKKNLFDLLTNAFGLGKEGSAKGQVKGDNPMADTVKNEDTASAKDVEDLKAEVNSIKESVGNAVTKDDLTEALKPLVEAQNAAKEAAANAEANERKELTDKLVASNSLTAEEAEGTPISVLRKMAGNSEDNAEAPKKAAAVNAGGEGNTDAQAARVTETMNRLNAKKESK